MVLKCKNISELVVYSLTDESNESEDFIFGKVPMFQGQEIAAITGVIIKGAYKIITAYGIRHTIKRHGNNLEEEKRGQIGVTPKDFDYIHTILINPDRVEKGNDGSRGKQALKLLKKISGKEYIVVMSVIKSRGDILLEFDTMYIKK